ncbi:MAG: hypothetical protein IH588_05060 [Anaerolineales bacterium]|nr:hypothetical protein [Anaerolineales bacterium]
MSRLSDFLPVLIEHFGSQRLRRIADLLLAIPWAMMAIVAALYFLLWHTDPLIRFTHMFWVLGFWMIGTIAMFAFITAVRLRLGMRFQILLLFAITIAIAIYFTPLSIFTSMFPRQISLILPALIGVLNLTICWFVVLRFRNKVIETQSH